MKTTRNYLKNASKHLFKFNIGENVYFLKIILNGEKDQYSVLLINEDLTIKSSTNRDFKEYVSSAGKAYVPTEFKGNFRYDGMVTIKHFKKIKEVIETETMKHKQAA